MVFTSHIVYTLSSALRKSPFVHYFWAFLSSRFWWNVQCSASWKSVSGSKKSKSKWESFWAQVNLRYAGNLAGWLKFLNGKNGNMKIQAWLWEFQFVCTVNCSKTPTDLITHWWIAERVMLRLCRAVHMQRQYSQARLRQLLSIMYIKTKYHSKLFFIPHFYSKV